MTFSTYYAHTDPLFKDLNILTIYKLVVHRIGIAIYQINNGLFLSVLNELYKKNNVIHDHNTRTKDMFRVSLGTQTFSTVSARIWNALIVKFNVNVPLTRFKVSLKLYLSSNILTISYPKYIFNNLSKHTEISFFYIFIYLFIFFSVFMQLLTVFIKP